MRIVSHPKKPAVQKPVVAPKPFLVLSAVRVSDIQDAKRA